MENRAMTTDVIIRCCRFRDNHFITELQTNGEAFVKEPEQVMVLAAAGLNVLAYSIDHLDALKHFHYASLKAIDCGVTVRTTCILTEAKDYAEDLEGIVLFAKEHSVHQLTFRIPTVPTWITDHGALQWINEHVDPKWITRIQSQLEKTHTVRTLNFDGVEIHSVQGLAVTLIPNCIQEHSHDTDIRSLIYHQDGHLYTSWAHPGSRIF
jgi:hypothetical protein